jgi:hypothetical protein
MPWKRDILRIAPSRVRNVGHPAAKGSRGGDTKVELEDAIGAAQRIISGNEYGCHGLAPKVGGLAGRRQWEDRYAASGCGERT